ncbi:MAG: response regulator [Flavobacteriaceae bacterium]|nr:response regulator [Flavobacteriaceae bacterium]|tara:strand:- start:68008 stop:68427 length:420 start_codon:yes stop_codon:yes gene_type:complete
MKQLDTILLIDDDPAINFLHKLVIKKEGVAKEIVAHQSAEAALDYLKENAKLGYHYPELIFLDLNMPGMDGWEFIEEYEKLDNTFEQSKIVVMLSTSTDPKDRKKADFTTVVNQFLNKPLRSEDIQYILENNTFPTYST